MSVELIQSVAQRLFAHQGFHGTSVRDITEAAGVNVSAITYHFGSKLELYHRVLTDLTTPLIARGQEINDLGLAPLDSIERRVRGFFEHVRGRPEMVPLMVREMASAEDLAAPIAHMIRSVMPNIVRDITAGQQDGSIRAGDPMLLTISTMAQPVYLNLARKGLTLASGRDPMGEGDYEKTVEHCVRMVRFGLENRP